MRLAVVAWDLVLIFDLEELTVPVDLLRSVVSRFRTMPCSVCSVEAGLTE